MTAHDLPAPDGATPAAPMHWGADALWAALAPLLPDLSVEVVARIGSTNTELLERLRRAQSASQGGHRAGDDRAGPATPAGGRRQGDAAACLLVAEHQFNGRGRQGKVWQAAPGGSLTFSLALPLAPADWSGLSLAVGLALADAIDPPVADQPAQVLIKWPNDLLLLRQPAEDAAAGERAGGTPVLAHKLGGILIETLPLGVGRYVVIGIGLNVRPDPTLSEGAANGRSPELSWGRADLQSLDAALDAPAWLARVVMPLVQAVRAFEQQGFAPLVARYQRRDALLGQRVATTLPGVPEGLAEGVDDRGTLWVSHQGRRYAVASGEVSLRRVVPGGQNAPLGPQAPGTPPAPHRPGGEAPC